MAVLNFLHKNAPGEVMVLIQNFLFHHLLGDGNVGNVPEPFG